MWEPSVVVSLVFGLFNVVVVIVTVTIAVTKLGGKIDVVNTRLGAVEKDVVELKNSDRRLLVMEERQTNHAKMISIVQEDNQLLRTDIQSLRLGIDRNRAIVERVVGD